MGWKPIETAPKDRPVLVYAADGHLAEFSQRIAVATYDRDFFGLNGNVEPMFIYAPYRGKGDGAIRVVTPSHWMELPKPPKGDE